MTLSCISLLFIAYQNVYRDFKDFFKELPAEAGAVFVLVSPGSKSKFQSQIPVAVHVPIPVHIPHPSPNSNINGISN